MSTFSANLQTLTAAQGDPETMAWWRSEPGAWAACRENLRDPKEAMTAYVEWVDQLPGEPVFVGYPVVFDFLFVSWYMIRFAGRSPFSHSALDIKTFAMAMLKKPYRESTKRNMPKHWFDPMPHTHLALDDAIERRALFCNMLREHLG